ncbi:MAG: threonine--tRNA ligase [Syntrophomonadaceae bacterium]|nr:threonine--tRNA ligase [Syntrophomonadaceae bacterium]
MVNITLKDGGRKEYPSGTTVLEMVQSFAPGLARKAVAARFNDELVDLTTPVTEDGSLEILTFDDDEGQEVYRHTSTHIMAQAVKRLFPDVRLAIGPAIDKGFYYDFDSAQTFTPEDFVRIEEEMRAIIKEDFPVVREEVSREEALQLFHSQDESYKVELIEALPEGEVISLYRQGEFVDLCAGPHLPSTGKVKAAKLTSLAGAYWRGDERNKMLQRIYGTSFPKKAMLDDYLHKIEEAKKRDHRRLGKELGLFIIAEEGPGFPFFLPRGMIIRNELEDLWRKEHVRAGYQEIKTPVILNRSLWERSGHWDHYRENMYFTTIDEDDYAIKPMNCPGGILVYKEHLHSYRELPIRLGELGLVHRHEKSGVLHGLMRVRAFTQDDAHLFMLPSQITSEIKGVIDMVDRFYNLFGFSYHVELSTRPENAMGSEEVWETATAALREALQEKGIDYVINEGDGAFYGPKIDFHLQDSLDRTWQCGTIQLDFLMPEKFDLTYVGEDGERHRPVMIHRVIYGSIERFIGILTEHFAGAFPTWLAPVQVRIIPIAERHHDYAFQIEKQLREAGLRAESDLRREKVGYKIRDGEVQRIPYLLITGDREVESSTVSVRRRNQGDLGAQSVEEFMAAIGEEISARRSG